MRIEWFPGKRSVKFGHCQKEQSELKRWDILKDENSWSSFMTGSRVRGKAWGVGLIRRSEQVNCQKYETWSQLGVDGKEGQKNKSCLVKGIFFKCGLKV